MQIAKIFAEISGDAAAEVQLGVCHKRLDSELVKECWRKLGLLSLDLFHDGVVVRVSFTVFAQPVNLIFDCFHLLL